MNITTVNLSDGQLRELRALGVANVSELMRSLIQAYIKRLRGSKKEFLKKKEKAQARLAAAERLWFEVELERARAESRLADVEFYEGCLVEPLRE